MREIQDILDQEPLGTQGGNEQFVDPLIYPLADRHGLAWRRSWVAGNNHASARHPLLQWYPAALKEFDNFPGVRASRAGGRGMSQHTLDLGMRA